MNYDTILQVEQFFAEIIGNRTNFVNPFFLLLVPEVITECEIDHNRPLNARSCSEGTGTFSHIAVRS